MTTEAKSEAEHSDGAFLACLVQGSERLGASVVDQGAQVAVVLEVAEELLAVLAHHLAPQVEIVGARGAGHARRLEDARRHDVEHPTADSDLGGIAAVQHE
ncbi:MAG: hypothetical protein ACRD0K_20750 [Egibacteraceae bacterium]